MTFRLQAVLFILAISGAYADTKLARLLTSAESLDGLGGFLERYIGNCGQTVEAIECRSSVSAFRKKVNGKRFHLVLSEEAAGGVVAFNSRGSGGRYVIQITPFFEGGGYALTHGAPKKTDASGNPMLPLLFATARIPDGWDIPRLQRLAGSRQVRLELIFVPKDVWALPKKGGGKIQGVKADVEAIQVINVRTGELLGAWPE